jgi:TPR repeat protein
MRYARLVAAILVWLSPIRLQAQSPGPVRPANPPSPYDSQVRPDIEENDTKQGFAPQLPVILHFCAAHCSTWYLKDGVYTGTAGNFDGKVKVVSFKRDSVVMDRSDPPNKSFPKGLRAVISGRMSPAGNSLVSGQIKWTLGPSGTYPVRMTWGTALNDIPGQDTPGAPTPTQEAAVRALLPSGLAESILRSLPGGASRDEGKLDLSATLQPSTMDLNGVWQYSGPGFGPRETRPKVLFVQLRSALVGVLLEGAVPVPLGYVWLESRGPVGKISEVTMEQWTNSGTSDWAVGDLHLEDPDHVRVGDLMPFTRIERRTVQEQPCDIRNPGHISAEEAEARATIYDVYFQDVTAGTCWMRVGADQGSRPAQESYAVKLWKGEGVAQDINQAFLRFQKLAMQGSYYAAGNLGLMFANGAGTLKSKQRSSYWLERAHRIDPHILHAPDNVPTPRWAKETASDCAPGNPSGANAEQAFLQGRVAYQARALPPAACWFQISAAQGLPRAKIYLGILYAFGLGVEKDPARGFAYMQEAAQTNDGFALMYLGSFYRFGIGTSADRERDNYLERKVLQEDKRGFDIYTQVLGLKPPRESWDEAFERARGYTRVPSRCHDRSATPSGESFERYEKECLKAQDDAEAAMLFSLAPRVKSIVDYPEEIFPELVAW